MINIGKIKELSKKARSKKYEIILADPAWSFRDKCHSGKRGVEYKYPTMTLDQIKKLDVESISAQDSVLFLWIPWVLVFEAKEVMRSWGFEYKTIGFVWVKLNSKSLTDFVGMGNWTRSNSEICLLGVRGKPKRVSAKVRQIIMEPRPKQHSRKPACVRDKIVELCGSKPRVELFATEEIEGWDNWGNVLPTKIKL